MKRNNSRPAPLKTLAVSLSITDRCSQACAHCSTKAGPRGKSVPFGQLEKTLPEIAGSSGVLYISCEGDPLYYRSGSKDLSHVLALAARCGFRLISIQCAVPVPAKLPLFRKALGSAGKTRLFVQLSFNPYSARARAGISGYLDDFKAAVSACSSMGLKPHLEIRGDPFMEENRPERLEAMARYALDGGSTCPCCGGLISGSKSACISPLGRAEKLFPSGMRGEKAFWEHVSAGSRDQPRCENWFLRDQIFIDTAGFPQLCYSNFALMPGVRNRAGPNLYIDGFRKVLGFYQFVWKGREDFLKKPHGRKGENYCPIGLFREALGFDISCHATFPPAFSLPV